MSENNKENMPKVEESLPKLFFYEKDRLESFKSWPYDAKSTCSVLKVIFRDPGQLFLAKPNKNYSK
jgi:hypothetical protein